MSDARSGSRVPWLAMAAVVIVGAGLLWWTVASDKPQWAWLVSLLLVCFVMQLWGYDAIGVWRGIFIDRRNVISLSRFQMVLWTIILVATILAAALWNLHMKLDALSFTVPAELFALMGISVGSAVGSSLILTTKAAGKDPDPEQFERQKNLSLAPGNAAQQAAEKAGLIHNGLVVANAKPEMARWSDMVTGDETGNFANIDLSKCQMLLFTVIAVVVYALSLWTLFQAMTLEGGFTTFPDFDKTILTLIGISHAGYLTYKATPKSETKK